MSEYLFYSLHLQQGVTLTGRNTTGPAMQCYRGAIIRLQAAWRHHLVCVGEATWRTVVECYRRRQMLESKTILAPYTMCRRPV